MKIDLNLKKKTLSKEYSKLDMVAHTCNPSTWQAEAGSQLGLHGETLSQSVPKKTGYK
jgi:hypothetical protein